MPSVFLWGNVAFTTNIICDSEEVILPYAFGDYKTLSQLFDNAKPNVVSVLIIAKLQPYTNPHDIVGL